MTLLSLAPCSATHLPWRPLLRTDCTGRMWSKLLMLFLSNDVIIVGQEAPKPKQWTSNVAVKGLTYFMFNKDVCLSCDLSSCRCKVNVS